MRNFRFSKNFSPESGYVRLPVFLCLLIFIVCCNLYAQSDLSLWGQITDASTGLPIADSRVIITPGGQLAVSDQNGFYKFNYLPQNSISITVQAYGYNKFEASQIDLLSDKPVQFDIKIKPLEYSDPDIIVRAKQEYIGLPRIVITSQSPEYKNSESLGELLEYLPGVVVISSGGGNQTALVSINGAPARQTGIFIDGQPLNSHLTGDFDINSIPKHAVEKIELYQSGAGAEFGEGALQGAINIVTRKALLKSKLELLEQQGSYKYNKTTLSLQTKLHDHIAGLFIFARNTASNNFKYTDDKLDDTIRQNNNRDLENYYLNLYYIVNSQNDLTLTLSRTESSSGLPGAEYQLTPEAHKSESFYHYRLSGNFNITNKYNLTASWQYYQGDQHFSDPGSFIPYDSKYKDQRTDLNILNRYMLSPDQTIKAKINIGSNRFRQENENDPQYSNLRVNENHALASLHYDQRWDLANTRFSFEQLNLSSALVLNSSELYQPLYSPALRFDLEQDYGLKVNYHIAYSKSYRAPTYASLFWSEDAFSVGNPDLKPEKSEDFYGGCNLNLDWQGHWNFGCEYQHSFIQNLIVWQRRFDGKYVPENLNAALVSSLRWSFNYNLAENLLQVHSNYSLSDPRDRSFLPNQHDRLLTFYPRKMLNLAVHINPGIFHFGIKSRWVSQRYIRAANTKQLDSYNVTDLSAGLVTKIRSFEFSCSLKIDNIFSESYEIIERYPLPRRSYLISLGLSYNYKSGGLHVF